MAPPTASDYSNLGTKFSSEDPDIRYMSLVDLGRFLETSPPNVVAQSGISTMIVDNLIKLLDDTNGDVQNQALKCIQPFTAKVSPEVLIPFVQKVVNLETSKSQDASISSTAARTLVLSLPHPVQGGTQTRQATDAYHAVSQVLIPKLLGRSATLKSGGTSKGFINFDSQKGVNIEALDLMSEVIRCYGSLLTPLEIKALEECLTKVLNDKNTGAIAKKRAIASLAKLSTWFANEDLSAFISRTVEDFRQSHITIQKRRLLIAVLGAMARSIPVKFGPYLQTIAPFVLSPLSQQELDDSLEAIAEDNYDAATDDLKETALTTVEDFLLCCPTDMRSFTEEVIDSGLRYLSYNPAIVGESDDEMADEDEDVFDEDDDYEQEEQFDDEDDTSWKIRRSAGKTLSALISTRPDLMEGGQFYERILPALTKTFKDREESVQVEALSAATLIIQKTADTVTTPLIAINGTSKSHDLGGSSRKRRRVNSNDGGLTQEELSRGYASPAQGLQSPTSGPRTDLLAQSPSVIVGAINLLSQKSVASRQAAIALLKTFVHIKHDSLSGQLDKVLTPVVETILLSHTSSMSQSLVTVGAGGSASGGTLRIAALQLLATIFDTHSSTITSPFVDEVIKAIALSVDDRNLKIASEALDAAESIIKALTPPRAFGYDKKSKQYIEAMFDIVLEKAESTDADLEVRQKAIQALGVCIARTAQPPENISADRRKQALKFLHERLAIETTRIPAALAIDLILSADQIGQIDAQWANGVALELGNHLRKADRRLRSVSLAAIKKVTGNSATKNSLDQETLQTLTSLVLQLYNGEGLTHIVLVTEILSDLVSISPQTVVTSSFNQTICHMVVQNLGGHTLDSFLELTANIGAAGVGAQLMNELLQKVGIQGDPHVVGTTIGTLLASSKSTSPVKVSSFVSEVNSKADDRRVALALIVLGEVGSILGSESKITPDIFVSSLNSKSESVQAAAATSLGRAAATNTAEFMPVLFKIFQTDAINRTLGLLAVKELLQQVSKSNSGLANYSQQLWDTLLGIAAVDETRSLAAECIGRLVALEPAKYFPLLQDHLSNTRPGIRGAVIQAVRFAVSDADEASDEALRPYLFKMLVAMLQDSNIENKRLAMATLHSAARNKPRLVLGSLSQLLPYVIKASEVDPRLIREVQMGPFKHKVDDGLEMRKGAYETLHAFIDLAYSRMNHVELFDRILAGLQDDHDVKMLAFRMLTKLISIDRDELGRRLDAIGERFQGILATKLKDNAVKQEVEKLKDTIKEVLILTVYLRNEYSDILSSTSGSTTTQAFKTYLEIVKKDFSSQLQAAETEIRSHG